MKYFNPKSINLFLLYAPSPVFYVSALTIFLSSPNTGLSIILALIGMCFSPNIFKKIGCQIPFLRHEIARIIVFCLIALISFVCYKTKEIIPVPSKIRQNLIQRLKKSKNVINFNFNQTDNCINLFIQTNNKINKLTAKKMAYRFYRIINQSLQKSLASKKVNRYYYDYDISVLQVNGKVLAQGFKLANSSKIYWKH